VLESRLRRARAELRLSQALVLRADAVSNGALALFLLAGSWDELWDFFGLPRPEPAFYAQLIGAALSAFAIVEWALAGTAGQRAVTLAAAVGSAIGAAVLAVWLAAGKTGAGTHGLVALWSVAALLAAAAAIHAVVLVRTRESEP
jgi:hypothetical protein